jgi:hypothetical protein
MPKPSSRAPSTKRAVRRARRRATLEICGPDSRRPGGRLFHALCELADRFLQRRGDPWASQLGTVLFYVAFHSARSAEDDDFRLLLRSSLDTLVELEPIERWLPAPPPPQAPAGQPLPQAPAGQPPLQAPAGQPAPRPYPTYAGADLPAPWSRR